MKCEKCNAPLSGSMVEKQPVSNGNHSVAEHLKKTVPESGGIYAGHSSDSFSTVESICSKCGYPLGKGMNVCPNCGNSAFKPSAEVSQCVQCRNPLPSHAKFCPVCGASVHLAKAPHSGTVPGWDSPQQGGFCTLKPIAWKGEEVQYNPITYSGDTISLNRSNTDPNNHTITSKVQAMLTREGNDWYIEDRSEQHSTLIRVRKKIKLENGDVIVLGNRMFEFKG